MNGSASYLGWGWLSISVPNLIVILVMILLFVLAIVLPFPTDRHPRTLFRRPGVVSHIATCTPRLASQELTQRSGRAPTKHEVRDRPDRLNDATQNPQRLGTTHLPTRTPCQVRKGHGGQYHLNRRASEDGRSLASGEVAPPLLCSHDCHASPNGSTRRSGQAA